MLLIKVLTTYGKINFLLLCLSKYKYIRSSQNIYRNYRVIGLKDIWINVWCWLEQTDTRETPQRNVRKVIYRHWHNSEWLFFQEANVYTMSVVVTPDCLIYQSLLFKIMGFQLIDNCFCGEQRKKITRDQLLVWCSSSWRKEERRTTSLDRFHNNKNSIFPPINLKKKTKTKLNLLYMFSIFHLLMILVLKRGNLNKDTVTSTCISPNQSRGFDKNKEHRFLEPSC